jgi:tetratricopeptide (TPR) repeat protein
MQIHIQRGQESFGPLSLEETTQYLSERRLLETDLAWHEGLEEWMPLGQVCAQLGTQSEAAHSAVETSEEAPSTFGQGRYRCQQLLGEGGMGQVWLVYDEQLERHVALKTLHQRSAADIEALRELKEEVQKCLELTHPNIIRIYDLAEPPGEDAFISMEYVSGEDLYERLKQHPEGRFSWKDIEPYASSLCDALEYAHDHGMVHRDLKPQNLIVTQENELKLADFGIAAPATGDEEEAVPRAGTPVYWGPQQAQGMTPAPTDDIYSFGITLYHLLVGDAPFLGANEPEITRQHIEDEPMHPQQKLEELGEKGKIPGYVSDLILKCLAKKPTERFQRAGEVRAWIEAKGDPAVKKQKRMMLAAGVMGVVALAMGGLAIWAWTQRTEAEVQRGVAVAKQVEAETARAGEAKERKKAEIELKKAQAVSKFVGGIFTAVKPGELENASDEDKDLLKLVLNKGAERIKDLEGQPEVEASIRNILGKAYYSLAFYDEAFVHHERALALRLELFGPDHLDVAISYNNTGMLYRKKVEYDQALEHVQKALAIRLKQLGPDHPDVADSYNTIGILHNNKGEYDKTMEYFQKALAIRLKGLRPDHPDVAKSYDNIGAMHYKKDEHDQAIAYYQKSLAIRLEQYGPDHPKMATTHNLIGNVHYATGEYDQAIAYHQKALAIRLKSLGPNHPDVALTYNNIGLVHRAKAEYDQALEYFQKALAIRLKGLGPDHPDVAMSYKNIGLVHRAKAEYDQAIAYFQKALATRLKKLPKDHPKVARDYNNIGDVHSATGEHDQAIACYQKALAIRLKQLGPDHPDLVGTYGNLAWTYKDMKDMPKAKEYFEKVHAFHIKKFGPDHQSTKKYEAELDQLAQAMKATPNTPALPKK